MMCAEPELAPVLSSLLMPAWMLLPSGLTAELGSPFFPGFPLSSLNIRKHLEKPPWFQHEHVLWPLVSDWDGQRKQKNKQQQIFLG